MGNILYQVTIPQWLQWSPRTRSKLKQIFDIPRSGGSQIQDSVVLSDGHTHADLAKISVEAMQAYLGTDDVGFFQLLDRVLERVEDECEEDDAVAQDLIDKAREESNTERKEAVLRTMSNLSVLADELSTITPKRRGRPARS